MVCFLVSSVDWTVIPYETIPSTITINHLVFFSFFRSDVMCEGGFVFDIIRDCIGFRPDDRRRWPTTIDFQQFFHWKIIANTRDLSVEWQHQISRRKKVWKVKRPMERESINDAHINNLIESQEQLHLLSWLIGYVMWRWRSFDCGGWIGAIFRSTA